jgi:hypothetical protein
MCPLPRRCESRLAPFPDTVTISFQAIARERCCAFRHMQFEACWARAQVLRGLRVSGTVHER